MLIAKSEAASEARPRSFGAQFPSIQCASEARAFERNADSCSHSAARFSNNDELRSRQSRALQVDLIGAENRLGTNVNHIDCQTSEWPAARGSGHGRERGVLSFGQKETLNSGDNFFRPTEDLHEQSVDVAKPTRSPLMAGGATDRAEESRVESSRHTPSQLAAEPALPHVETSPVAGARSEQHRSQQLSRTSRSIKQQQFDRHESDKASHATMDHEAEHANVKSHSKRTVQEEEQEKALTSRSVNERASSSHAEAAKTGESARIKTN